MANTSLILTLIGPDKPGLIDAASALIAENNGNWLESRMCRLGGQFAGIVHISIPEEMHPNLMNQLESLSTKNLTVSVFADAQPADLGPGQNAKLEIVGNDRPGIVRHITHVLASHQVNVIEMNTEVLSAPMSGGPLFQASLLVQIPGSCSSASLKSDLERVASDLQVDITLH